MSVSIVSYGALPGGVIDNAAAFSAAITQAAIVSEEVLVPAGTWACSGFIELDSVTITGVGDSSVIHMLDWTHATINMRGTSPRVRDLRLTVATPGFRDGWDANRIIVFGATGFEISGVLVDGGGGAGILTQTASNGVINNNRVRNTLADSIHMTDGSNNILVTDNTCTNSGDDNIAVVSYVSDLNGICHDIIARRNTVSDNVGGRGMSVVGGQDILYEHNRITNTGTKAGILIAQESSFQTQGCARITVQNNTLTNCGGVSTGHAAIFVNNSNELPNDDILISLNDIIQTPGAGQFGIRVDSGDNNNVVVDQNRISGTTAPNQVLNQCTPPATVNAYVSGAVGAATPVVHSKFTSEWTNDDGEQVSWINSFGQLLEWTYTGGGQEFTLSQGTVEAAVTVALVGIGLSIATGTITPNNADIVTLTGEATTLVQGSVSPDYTRALTGSGFTFSDGTLVAFSSPPALTGQATALGQGTVSASGNSVTVNITGSEFTLSAGTVSSGFNAISGQSTTLSAGTVGLNLSMPLIGQELSVSAGSIAPEQDAVDTLMTLSQGSTAANISIELVGEDTTLEQGNVAVTGDVTLPLIGEASTVSAGSVGFEKAFPISGQEFVLAQQSMGAPGGVILTGQSMTVSPGDVFTTTDRAFALIGQSMTIQDGITFASPLAFVIGQELTLSAQEIGPRDIALTGVSMSFEAGELEIPHRDHGAGHKKHHRKHHLEVDGHIFPVDSEEEAIYILEKVKEEAQAAAKLALERAQKAQRRPVRKVMQDARKALDVPEIEVSEDLSDPAKVILSEIEDLYKDTLRTIEIAALLRKQDEEEEELLLMLL